MKNLILFVLTLLSLGSSAQIKRTIHVATAGTLSNFISENEKYQIEELTLTGKLNGTDFLYIRDMAGVNAYINDDGDLYPGHKTTNGKLNTLNLSQADIVSGGSFYEHSGETGERYERLNFGIYYTNDNCVSKYLFSDTRIKSIILPNSVTSIEPEAFFNCSNLSSIIIESGNSYYDSRNDCNAIIEKSTNTLIVGCKNTIIPNGVTSIGKNAFYNCSGLTSINIPNSVKSIDSRAFAVCSDLTSITIPNSVTSIGDESFQSCTSLASITFPNSVINIGYRAFMGTIWEKNQPKGLVYAGKVAYAYFGEMPANTNIIIKEGTLGIASGAFSGCICLTSVTIPNSVTSIGNSAFYNCSGLTSINIPNSVTSIGSSAFSGCSSLTAITIPSGVTSIDVSSFYSCSSLTSIKVESDNQKYDSRNNCDAIIETSSNALIIGCKNTTIPNGVTSIGGSAFSNCSGLTSVTIPNSVTSIGNGAFYGCSGLTSVTIPNSVESIGWSAFSDCISLTIVVSKIENPFDIHNAFYSYPNEIYATATLFVPAGKKSAYEAKGGWNSFTNIKEIIDGDMNLDEKVNKDDLDALVAHIMGEKPEGFYEELADLNGDDDVDAADVVTLVDILNNGGLNTDSQFDFDNVDGSLVVSSLICTLNNKRNEAIQLTKCELYCKGNLVSYKNFSYSSVTAGGSKECSFNNLTKHAADTTDFIVCWHYTVNGEAFVYRCPLTD